MSNPAKIKCRVATLDQKGDSTYLLELEPLGRVPRFKAGQFLHLTVDDYDPAGGFWPESRVFSIASRSGASRITIVYSVKGRYTRHIEETLRPGSEVWVKLPFGDFIIDSRMPQDADVVLIAGGTGISPFIPFLEEQLEKGERGRNIRLYYGLRSPAQLLFRDLLERCVASGLVDFQLWLESGAAETANDASLGPVRTGRLSPHIAFEECKSFRAPVFFLSGPPAMIDVFKTSLLKEGLEPDRIQIDEWE